MYLGIFIKCHSSDIFDAWNCLVVECPVYRGMWTHICFIVFPAIFPVRRQGHHSVVSSDPQYPLCVVSSRPHKPSHYDDVIMGEIAPQITSLTIVYSTVLSGVDQSKHQSSASLAFVWEIHRWPVNFPHKWPVTRKIFPFDDVIMIVWWHQALSFFCGYL